MNVIIVERDEEGKPNARQVQVDPATIAEPSAVFWETRAAIRGPQSAGPAERQAFIRGFKKWFAARD
jgi:hypothetical protein